jgi:hypothetical protein
MRDRCASGQRIAKRAKHDDRIAAATTGRNFHGTVSEDEFFCCRAAILSAREVVAFYAAPT